MEVIDILQSYNLYSVMFRLFSALVIGVLIGYDRSKKGSPAGVKTHSLVCIGAALVMLTGEFCNIKYGQSDITRMAAQVISGIGFLGAGTILVTGKHQIKGLTSAAGIWFSACVGIAIGAGFYVGAFVAALMEVVIMNLFTKLKITETSDTIKINLGYNNNLNIGELIEVVKESNAEVISVDHNLFAGFDLEINKYAVITIQIEDGDKTKQLFNDLSKVKGVIYFSIV